MAASVQGSLKELVKASVRYNTSTLRCELFGRAYNWMRAHGLTEGQSHLGVDIMAASEIRGGHDVESPAYSK